MGDPQEKIDDNINMVLASMGNLDLKSYTPATQDKMRKAMREIMHESYCQGSDACHRAMKKVYG